MPDEHIFYHNRSNAYRELSEIAKALDDANKCIELQPGYAWGYICKGRVFEKKKELSMAGRIYKEAFKICKQKDPLKRAILGLSKKLKDEGDKLFDNGEYDKAIKFDDALIDLEPNNPHHYRQRSITYRKLGKCQESLQDGNKCIELKQDWDEGYIVKGRAYVKRRSFQSAIKVYETGLQYCVKKDTLNNEIDLLLKGWKKQLGRIFTTQELTDRLIYGYIRAQIDIKVITHDVIQIIAIFHGLYYMAGWMRMTMKEVSLLKVGDKVDYRNKSGKFIYSTVSQKSGDRLRIELDKYGQSSKANFKTEYYRFAVAGSISRRPAYRFRDPAFKIDDHVRINLNLRHQSSGWTDAQIVRLDDKSGQIGVKYKHKLKYYTYWIHGDNEAEIEASTHLTNKWQKEAIKKKTLQDLKQMHFEQHYINKACKLYQKYYGKDYMYNIDQIIEIILRMDNEDRKKRILRKFTTKEITNHLIYGYIHRLDKQNKIPYDLIQMIEIYHGLYYLAGWMRMTIKEVSSLRIGDTVDYRDRFGKFVHAKVFDKFGNKLTMTRSNHKKIEGALSNSETEYYRFAAAGSISNRKSYIYFQKGHRVHINPRLIHPGWKDGKVVEFHKYSGQLKVTYQHENRTYQYWVHRDDQDEIRKTVNGIKKDLEYMGFDQNDINQAFKEYQKYYGENFNIDLMVDIIGNFYNYKFREHKSQKSEILDQQTLPQ